MPQSEYRFSHKLLFGLLLFLVASAAYLYPFPQPNVLYAGVVLLHTLGGVLLAILLVPFLWRRLRTQTLTGKAGWLLLAGGAALGIALIYTGTPRQEWRWLYLHIVLVLAAVALLFADWAGRRGWLKSLPGAAVVRALLALAVLAGLSAGAWYQRNVNWQSSARIHNPPDAPASMNGEGDGPKGPFFPSSAQVYGGQKIPSKFFMESDSCKRCHEDIYREWYSSAHHFSSFNNQWYRMSI